ncbi:MAG: MarR family transcriptional regulator [Methanobacteriaceae archaeon]|nr:MarR family transcriptional regulator [Methanobacteriaceae archaeon]
MSNKKVQIEDDSPLGALLFLFHKNQHKYINNALREYGLNINQALFILRMYYSEEYLCQDDLADAFYLSKSAIAKSLKDLEEKEFIMRERLSDNKRKYVLVLSAKGEAMVPIIKEINKDWEEKMKLDKVDKKFMNTLMTLTKRSIRLNN